jgi:hypothetical protein
VAAGSVDRSGFGVADGGGATVAITTVIPVIRQVVVGLFR